ncbi:hypothetical protein TRFO_19054 [Tritrichomonas foetus]|uniref:Exocyst component Exo84 C-terminal domain-containing protein n=1 Tax=Tritrichomonas foetus TaxID=1144522 RepID=A0A1J4KQ03_9EUKA|nr:hypothetical protein TRFO_19054 [Tritrichomonas foetus]|eukprot:OHT11509.1 hypothetical protein TRFO_19054 [Tritrichomonas foetus]
MKKGEKEKEKDKEKEKEKKHSKKDEKHQTPPSPSPAGGAGRINFASEDFNAEVVAKQICEMSNAEVIKKQIEGFDNIRAQVNSNIVGILEKDSSLFVSLSQCISLFEREFLEFPQRIAEIQKLVDEARAFPIPKFAEVPKLPRVKNSEILDQPATLVDAHLIYDSLVKQHRISESVDLVVNVIKSTCLSSYKPIKQLDEWIQRTRKSLLKDITGRLKTMSISSEEGQHEFMQLVQLGYETESVQLYIQLATQTIEEKLNSIQNTGQLLQFVRESTEILCNELVEKASIFLKLFHNSHFLPTLLVWMNQIIDTKLPIAHPQNFSGNYNLVKDSVVIMRKELKPLEYLGISTLNIFDTLPKRFIVLLSTSAHQHMKDISEAIKADDMDINMDGIKKLQLQNFPLSSSFEHFRSHVIQFLQEMRSLYVPEMFYDCSKLLKDLVLAYSIGCKELLIESTPSIFKFCAILVQLVCVEYLLLPETLKEFTDITKYDFPDEQLATNECRKIMNSINQMLVQTFASLWSEQCLPLHQLQFEGIDDLDPTFAGGIEAMTQFLDMLNLPQNLFNETADLLVDAILDVVEKTGSLIKDVKQLNSFDFHWEYFSKLLLQQLPRSANEKLKAGIQSISNQIGADQGIDDKERETFRNITLAVKKCMKMHSEQ